MAKVPVGLDIEQLAQAIVALPRKQRAELWALLATFEERADPGAAEALSESEEDVRAGRLFTMEEVFGTTEA